MATRYTSVGVGMTIMSLSPILILAPAHWIFGQRIALQEIIGACISVLGVSLVLYWLAKLAILAHHHTIIY